MGEPYGAGNKPQEKEKKQPGINQIQVKKL
jgi:hypothetical protein